MRTLSVEVRTSYTIEVEFEDFLDAKRKWLQKDSFERSMFPNAFKNEETTNDIIRNEMKEFRPDVERDKLLAHCLGFDGWSHALLYHNDKLTMVVYKNGDTLN